MSPIPLCAAVVCALVFAAGPSLADDSPMSTAGAAATGETAAAPRPVEMLPVPTAAPPPLPQDTRRQARGAVEVGVGTGGYRRAAGVATVPLGKTGEVTVAVDRTEGRVRYQ